MVIRITPFAALDPYIEADAASFNTDIFSISSGFTFEMSLSTPSTITKGAELVKVPCPLTKIEALLFVGLLEDEFT